MSTVLEYHMPMEIQSAVWPAEARMLALLAQEGVVLEVGSDLGRSTIVMASTAKRVHAIDWHQGDGHAGKNDTAIPFISNITRYGLRDKIIVHIGTSEDVVPIFPRRFFDGAFLDAFHTYEAVLEDFQRIAPKVRPGGWVAFHDYGRPAFGVTQAVDEIAFAAGSDIEVVDHLAVLYLPESLPRRK